MDGGARRRAALVVTAVCVAVALPGVRMVVEGGTAPDGFPLSTYPMFTRDRGRIVDVPSVVVLTDDGAGADVERLSPVAIAGTDQVMEAHVAVAAAVRGGPATSLDLCRHVAAGLDERAPGETVAVVVERYDSLAWAAGDGIPLARKVVARCE